MTGTVSTPCDAADCVGAPDDMAACLEAAMADAAGDAALLARVLGAAGTPGPLGKFVRAFYDARRAAARSGDLAPLGRFLAAEVDWREPDVGAHMGALRGRGAVLDMIRRALDATGGSFDLSVAATVEAGRHVAAAVAWSAEKGGRRIEGRELAVYEIRDRRIAAARFHPDDIADDRAFWGEGPGAEP